jgi:lipopolysaccharide transport system ATP-binding protein
MIDVDDVWVQFTRRYHRERSLKDFVLHTLSGQGQTQKFWALQNIRFSLGKGEIMGLVGTNGSGKSTLLKVIGGLLKPDQGCVRVGGRVAPLLELGVGFEPSLSGAENIFFNGAVLKMSRQDIKNKFDGIVDFAELADVIDTPLVHYSTGMAMRLGFAIAAHSPAEILLIDEILAVGDSPFQKKCLEKILDLNRNGVTILFVSHSADLVKTLCQKALWIHKGVQKNLGSAADIVEEYRLFTDDLYRRQRDDAQRAADLALARKGRELEIKELAFFNGDMQPATVFKTFDTMTVRLQFEAKTRVTNPIIGMAIHHADGTHVCGPNTQECDFPIDHLQGRGAVDLTIPCLNMTPGEYLFSVALWDHTHTQAYDWIEKTHRFIVEPSSCHKHRGLVAMEYRWNLAR